MGWLCVARGVPCLDWFYLVRWKYGVPYLYLTLANQSLPACTCVHVEERQMWLANAWFNNTVIYHPIHKILYFYGWYSFLMFILPTYDIFCQEKEGLSGKGRSQGNLEFWLLTFLSHGRIVACHWPGLVCLPSLFPSIRCNWSKKQALIFPLFHLFHDCMIAWSHYYYYYYYYHYHYYLPRRADRKSGTVVHKYQDDAPENDS